MLGRNPTTGKYVMWMKGPTGFSFQVGEADSPDGTFHTVANLNAPFGAAAGGSQAFKHPTEDSAFIFYSNKEPREIRVAKLTPDWRDIEQKVLTTVGKHFEAPAPFYSVFTQKFYVLCSHLSGWWPNPAELFVADHPEGPWRSLGNPTGDDQSYQTQVAHVFPVGVGADYVEKFVYMSDRWRPYINLPEGGRYVFLPMEIRGKPLQAVNPHSHVVSRGPVLRGQKDGSIVIMPVAHDTEWSLEQWPEAVVQDAAKKAARGLPAVPVAAAVPDEDQPGADAAPSSHGSANWGGHPAVSEAAPSNHGSANWGGHLAVSEAAPSNHGSANWGLL